MIETLVFVYLGMTVAQFMWSLLVYAKVGRSEETKEAFMDGAQKAWREQFGGSYDGSISWINAFLTIAYYVAIIKCCVVQGLEWPKEVFYAIKYEFKGAE